MNNSTIALEADTSITLHEEEHTSLYQQKEAQLVRILEAINELEKTRAWSTLKSEIFDGLTATLEKELLTEARLENPNTNKLSRITGELKWSERFCDLSKFAERYRVELKAVRLRLHGKSE